MIKISNFTKTLVNEKFLNKIAKTILIGERIKHRVEISVVFVGEQRMRKLNQKYRKKDQATDVLSFPTEILKEKNKTIFYPSGLLQLGDIVICIKRVKKNATIDNQDLWEKELARVFIHGILHVLGHSHKNEKQKKTMWQKQEKYFSKIF